MTILVTAASKHGATMEIAEAIGRALTEAGMVSSVHPVAEVASIDSYEAVVLGSAVYMGHWLEPARTFATHNGEALKARPAWLFSSGPVGDPPLPKAEDAVKVGDLMSSTGARGHQLFTGCIDRQRLGFGERAVMRAVGGKEGDFRDWDAIAGWASEIATALKA